MKRAKGLKKGTGQAWQRPDHDSSFILVPRRVIDSDAWRSLSARSKAALEVFQLVHNGRNNGEIGLSIHNLSAALGDQNHRASSRSVRELIDRGFLECMAHADRDLHKAREYRITFISTGPRDAIRDATNDYLDWRLPPGARKKFGGARTARQNPDSVAATATDRKVSLAEAAPPATESRGLREGSGVADTARHICNHPQSNSRPLQGLKFPPASSTVPKGDDPRVNITELRDWMNAVVDQLGHGAARRLANDARIPEPAISRFRNGKGLPDQYRLKLQEACGRVLGHSQWKEAAE